MRAAVVLLVAVFAMFLGSPPAWAQDAGRRDAGTLDAGSPDAGRLDSGVADTGATDTGVRRDAGPIDVASIDVGLLTDGGPRVPGRCPNIMIVLDNSCSMSAPASGGDGGLSKWSSAVAAIHTLLGSSSDHNRFGLSLFPCPSCTAGCAAPTIAEARAVEPNGDTAAAIESALMAAARTCSTPTAPYLETLRADPALLDPTRASYALLITDGAPTCPGGAASIPQTVAAIDALFRVGVKTFVVGFDANVNATALDQFAVAGRTDLPATSPHRYYEVSDDASLREAFAAIAASVSEELGATLCDESCYSHGCPDGGVCSSAMCRPDPCAGVTCDAGQYCANGTCQHSCAAGCARDQICRDGACVADPCTALACNGCFNGICPTAGCMAGDGGIRNCGFGRVCVGDTCRDQPCNGVHCPTGTVCDHAGGCQGVLSLADGGARDGTFNDAHAGGGDSAGMNPSGCQCRAGFARSRTPLGWLAGAIAAVAIRTRRRASRRRA